MIENSTEIHWLKKQELTDLAYLDQKLFDKEKVIFNIDLNTRQK